MICQRLMDYTAPHVVKKLHFARCPISNALCLEIEID